MYYMSWNAEVLEMRHDVASIIMTLDCVRFLHTRPATQDLPPPSSHLTSHTVVVVGGSVVTCCYNARRHLSCRYARQMFVGQLERQFSGQLYLVLYIYIAFLAHWCSICSLLGQGMYTLTDNVLRF